MSEGDRSRRRRFRRRTVRVLVEYISNAGLCRDTATTLGAGGMFIETDQPLRTGSLLKLSFSLSAGGTRHEIEGQVVWSRLPTALPAGSAGMGIEFTDRRAAADLASELERL
jgi:Tfp pilus assembly protein PilZ